MLMTSRVIKFTTLNTTNLRQIAQGPCVLRGASLVNTSATPYYLKFYWFKPTASAATPTVGTTIPDLTIAAPPLVNAVLGQPGTLCPSWPEGLTGGGQLFVAVTAVAADNDTTAVAAGAGIISLILDGAP
jgi:hypothetical protein